jgi:hypothetical protein
MHSKDQDQPSLLQWLAPDLARAGLLRNEEWVPLHAGQAEKMFGSKSLSIAATVMATVDAQAIDYLRQAPILVALLARGNDCAKWRVRTALANEWLTLIRGRPKLRDLVNSCGAAMPLRALNGKAMCGSLDELIAIKHLSKLPSPRLAPSIPAAPESQRRWLSAMSDWTSMMRRRLNNGDHLLDWAAFAIGRYLAQERERVATDLVADYVIAGHYLNERWDWVRASAESLAWHREIERASDFRSIGLFDLIDYGKLPDRVEIDGYTIVALRSRAALFAEGVTMHHCVASYARDVRMGTSFIYSVRTFKKAIATLELCRLPSDTLRYGIVQLKGPCNAAVSIAIQGIALRFLDRVNGLSALPRR